MALQLDLDIDDLKFITQRVCSNAPMLRSLQLQPVKPTYKDFQLLVLACILGSMVGADTSGACSWQLLAGTGDTAQRCNSYLMPERPSCTQLLAIPCQLTPDHCGPHCIALDAMS